VRRARPGTRAAALLCALATLGACASSGDARRDGSRNGDYYGGSIHRNAFPETFGGGGPGRIGRPDRARY
jgi:hypothetical protein